MQKYTILKDHFQRIGKYNFLNIFPRFGHFFGWKGMINRNNVLANDGTLIQIIRHKMGSSPDDFYTPVKGLLVRLRPQ